MKDFNLLPSELAPKTSVVRFARGVKRIAVIGYSLLILGIVVSLSVYYLYNRKLNEQVTKNEELKTSIKALQETEQKLLLTQDRLSKADEIFSKEKMLKKVQVARLLLAELPDEVEVGDISISDGGITIEMGSDSSDDLSEIIDTILAEEEFKAVVLNSFNYAANGIYSATFKLNL
ncbi:MAG: hypothetical protein PVJ52_01995 [Candidatus Woesebacteria bacterium]|jgi:Tfp pilus assembly protein PilN